MSARAPSIEAEIAVTVTARGRNIIPASSRLSSLTLEASNTLLPPLRSHGQQLGDLAQNMVVSE